MGDRALHPDAHLFAVLHDGGPHGEQGEHLGGKFPGRVLETSTSHMGQVAWP